MEQSTLICVKAVRGKGRGVFARRAIKKGQIIERAPVVLVPIRHLVRGRKNPTLTCYFYQWDARHVTICLGYGFSIRRIERPCGSRWYDRIGGKALPKNSDALSTQQ